MATNPKSSGNNPLIPFYIQSYSSQDDDYPASELLAASHLSKGWQTNRFAVFPQTLILRLPYTCQVHSIQFLSHQCKIASKIDVFISNSKDSSDEPAFRKLGYFNLSSNEGSGYQSRELKTVYIDAPVQFVKFILHKPYLNSLNIFNQAGVIAISLHGAPMNSKGGVENGLPVKAKTSNDLQMRTQMDSKTLAQIDQLERSKELAIQQEDYQAAKQIKEQIDKLKAVSEQLLRLEQRKDIAIQNEDFDAAMILKEEIRRLRDHYSLSGQQKTTVSVNRIPDQPLQRRNYDRPPQDDFDSNANQYSNPLGGRGQQHAHDRREEMPSRGNNQMNRPAEDNWPSNPPNQRSNRYNSDETNEREDNYDRPVGRQNPRSANRAESRRDNARAPMEDNLPKQIVDFDDQPIPTANPNAKKDQFAAENEYPENQNPMNDQKNGQANVPAKNKAKIEKLSHIFDQSFLNQAYSSSFQERLTGAEKLSDVVSVLAQKPSGRLPSDIFVTSDIGQAMAGAWTLNLSFLEERPTQMINLGFQISKDILSACKNKQVAAGFKNSGDLFSLMDELVLVITEKITEFKNANIMDWALSVLIAASNLSFISHSSIIDKLTARTSKDKKPVKGIKEITGRLMLLQEIVRSTKDKIKNATDVVLGYAVENLENQTKTVRDEAHNLILEIFKIIGEEKTLKFLDSSKIRKPQLENLRKDFNDIEANEEDNEEEDDYEPPQKPAQQSKPRPGQIQQSTKPAPPKDYEEEGEGKPCNFCQRMDPAFDNAGHFDIHLWKECPMLTICTQCMQVIEVSDYNAHQLSECKNSHLFSKCNQCQQAIIKQDSKYHAKSCQPLKSDGKTFRCPLCLDDLILRGRNQEDMWRDHLVKQGCPSNERTS